VNFSVPFSEFFNNLALLTRPALATFFCTTLPFSNHFLIQYFLSKVTSLFPYSQPLSNKVKDVTKITSFFNYNIIVFSDWILPGIYMLRMCRNEAANEYLSALPMQLLLFKLRRIKRVLLNDDVQMMTPNFNFFQKNSQNMNFFPNMDFFSNLDNTKYIFFRTNGDEAFRHRY